MRVLGSMTRCMAAGAFAIALAGACGGSEVIARDGNRSFVEGSPCEPNDTPSCGWTSLDCDARTRTCVTSKACSADDECTDSFKCRMGIKSCAVACFEGFDYCRPGTHCDRATAKCVSDTTTERACLPNCTVGHECCAGSCSGPAVKTPNDCCACLSGEVNSMTCAGGRCGS
jgi:hypothetical protein